MEDEKNNCSFYCSVTSLINDERGDKRIKSFEKSDVEKNFINT